MKIRKVELSASDKRKAYRTAVRKAMRESGIDRLTRPSVQRNKKKYTRKGRKRTSGDE